MSSIVNMVAMTRHGKPPVCCIECQTAYCNSAPSAIAYSETQRIVALYHEGFTAAQIFEFFTPYHPYSGHDLRELIEETIELQA